MSLACHLRVTVKSVQFDRWRDTFPGMLTSQLQRALPLILAMLGLVTALPAKAERLSFDHRNYPALKAVFDSGQEERIAYDASNPRYVIDLIAIDGKSASDWREAMEIVARSPAKGMQTARDWFAEMHARPDGCKASEMNITEDAGSVTFERYVPNCPTARAETVMTRIVAGKRSLFRLTFLLKGAPDEMKRKQWLALLASAKVE